ncbi:MAG: PD40 domain-containing protein [Archangiaceae bacterium]|nr:PD40 domain-containing protein [Archangiaceae bacterium]
MLRLAAIAVVLFGSVACNCSDAQPGSTGGGASAGSGGGGGSGGHAGAGGGTGGASMFSDFPVAPILDGVTVPFAADAGTASAPCVLEPEDGTLYPMDWLRPRFSFAAANGEDGFQVTLRAPNQVNPLVVFTSHPSWTMPQTMWGALTAHSVDVDFTLEVRAFKQAASAVSPVATSKFRIAPAAAAGAIVYWTTSNGTALKGFFLGAETVTTVLTPPAVPGSQCIGCHTSSPDGLFAGFSSSSNSGNGDESGVAMAAVDGGAMTPAFLSAAGAQLLARKQQQAPTFSAGHWSAGDRVVVSNYNTGGNFELVWTDLEATSTDQGTGWGVLARNGDTGHPASPSFSHDGSKLVYVSSPTVTSGVTVYTTADLYTIPFANRAGGSATAVPGASDPNAVECYPSFSPDDALLTFARVPNGERSYDNPKAEVWVAPIAGATSHRVRANDPPACAMVTSPGITNSWPKWGPLKTTVGAKTYYWLTFSSKRAGARPQLYVAGVVVEGGTVTSTPAMYLWNQPGDEANHTPAWDLFQLPSIN